MLFYCFFDRINVFTKSEVKKMPNIKSAKKRVRSNAKKEKVNTLVTSSMKTAIKNFEKNVKSENIEEANKSLNTAIQRIDKAKKNGLIHQNKASRLKSKLTKEKNAMK